MGTVPGIVGTDDLGLVGMECEDKAGNNLDCEKAELKGIDCWKVV